MLCKHLDEFTGICCNADSEYIADVCPYCDVANETLICNRVDADCFEEVEKMTCKDCIHYEVCKAISWQLPFCNPKECDCFKDKSKCIELPCKVGDMVYVLDYEDDKAVDYSGYIFIMANNDFAFLSPVLNGKSNPVEICNEYFQRYINEDDNSGVIVPIIELFLTKSEAEQKLKELKENA